MQEIGSEFHWDDTYVRSGVENPFSSWTLLRSGRDCLRAVAQMERERRRVVLLPELCCQSMVDPFVQQGYQPLFYPLREDLTGDLSAFDACLSQPCIVLSLSYFGRPTLTIDAVKQMQRKYSYVFWLLDCTQNLLPGEEEKTVYDAIVTSVRKWLPLASGGALFLRRPTAMPLEEFVPLFAELRQAAMQKKTHYLQTGNAAEKAEFRELLAQAVHLIDTDERLVDIDEESRERVVHLDAAALLRHREENVFILREGLPSIPSVKPILDLPLEGGALYFPILAQRRDTLQQALAEQGIYCPVIWPLPEQCRVPGEAARRIAEEMLALPCDQRYTATDMHRILRILQQIGRDLSL